MMPGRPATSTAPPAAPPPSTVVGVLGGSFDPIHAGHLQLARDALVQLRLAEVRFLPAGRPWQKGPLTDAAHRAAMVLAAIRDEPRFALDMREIERPGPTYTIETLRELRTALGEAVSLVLLMGSDQFERLDTWRDWARILDYAHIAVARRADAVLLPGYAVQEFFNAHWARPEAVGEFACGRIVELAMTPVDASATEIRAALAEPPSQPRDARLARIVPGPVLDYIRAHHLYRQPPERRREPRDADPGLHRHRMDLRKLQRLVVDALEDVKAQDIKVFNTTKLTELFDRVIVAGGTSNRQTRALASSVVEKVKGAGGQVISVEGTEAGEWVLVDLGDVVVHIMQPTARNYYALEEIWGGKPVRMKLAPPARGRSAG
jgi:nicotinate (nicotinamide) nucleotide adenylyltransferase/ribosome silencing factor RsfS/YbeB/iojap